MYKGEIQRWRFVNANIDATAQLAIDFDGVVDNDVQAMQIAMDGVPFSPKNYQCQPLLDPTPCDGKMGDNLTFQFSPGNRADFLVKAPGSVGEFFVPYEVFGNVQEQGTRPTGVRNPKRVQRGLTREALDAVAPGATQPALLSINVVDCPQGMTCSMDFPARSRICRPSCARSCRRRSAAGAVPDPHAHRAATEEPRARGRLRHLGERAEQRQAAAVQRPVRGVHGSAGSGRRRRGHVSQNLRARRRSTSSTSTRIRSRS
jgi:hypothetical protein